MAPERAPTFAARGRAPIAEASGGKLRGEPRRLTFDERAIFGSDWTADGWGIVYASVQFGTTDLWMIPASGGTPERLTAVGGNAMGVTTSRIGNRLVYQPRAEWMKPQTAISRREFVAEQCLPIVDSENIKFG